MNPNTLPTRVIVGLIAASSLAACGDKVLDYRNVSVSAGKIYSGNSNTPFSGRVTNAPFDVTVPNQGPIAFIRMVTSKASDTGLWYTGQTVCDFSVSEGYRNGNATCRESQSGAKRYELSFSSGVPKGKVTVFAPQASDKPIATATIGDHGVDGVFEAFRTADHSIVYRGTFKDGQNISSEDFDTGGNVIRRYTLAPNGAVAGPITSFSKEGKRITYTDPRRVGDYDPPIFTYYPDSGKLHQCSVGLATMTFTWNESGTLVGTPDRRDLLMTSGTIKSCSGHLPPDTPNLDTLQATIDSFAQSLTNSSTQKTLGAGEDRASFPDEDNPCTRAWMTAYRNEVGSEAAINYQQAWEFVDNCRAGKMPK